MSDHTQEPWIVFDEARSVEVQAGNKAIFAAHFDYSADPEKQVAIANARRIVACVNACAGASHEFLEAAKDCGGITAIEADAHRYLVERNELLKALKDAWTNTPDGPCANRIRAVIDKVEAT